MTETIQRKLNDSAAARWTALCLLAGAMFFGYIFMDILSPLQELLATSRGWTPDAYGRYAGSETFLNVFVFFLIFAGIILDKMGVRFTAILSGSVMLIGAAVNCYAVSDAFIGSGAEQVMDRFMNLPLKWWNITPFYEGMPASAKMSALGFMFFGCGVEMAGITVSRGIVKWFKGKEMALAMGVEMAIARIGVAVVVLGSPVLANKIDPVSVSRPVVVAVILLAIGLINFIAYAFMDKKLEDQMGESGEEKDDPFKISDIGKLFTNPVFLVVALLCVLYYSAIFPFQRYAPNFLEVTLGVDAATASQLFSCFPILAMILTPLLGGMLDYRGKSATMLMLGAVIMIACHLSFAFLLPLFPSKALAVLIVVVLGVSFSLVPAALWPSVPKIIDEKILGSAYCLIFWIQNIGLFLVPLLIGKVLDATGGYTTPMMIFSSFGVLAFIFSFYLKLEDRKKGYGLELPNIKK